MPLRQPSPDRAARLRSLFAAAEFEPTALRDAIGPNEAASTKRANTPLLLRRTQARSALTTLVRLFLVGVAVDSDRARATLDATALDDLQECGLVREAPEGFLSDYLLTPYEGFLLAADRLSELESSSNSEAVLMVNRTTWRLGAFMLREPVESTLDLGSGCGALALVASRFSERVTATDLNPRAVEFARFNAALNGAENVECLQGDAWEPVHGQRFDRIVCNPPFFISPEARSMFSDNPMDLDGFCRKLAREAGEYLEPGGVFQMLCEWAETANEPWEQRVREWVEGVGCDAWIAKGYSTPADRYAHQRINEKAIDAAALGEVFAHWCDYFGQRGVTSIHGGAVALKRREGPNWVHVAELPAGLGDSSQAIRRRLDGLDYAHGVAEEGDILDSRPVLSEAAELSQRLRLVDGAWKPTRIALELRDGLQDSLPADPSVIGLLTALDGSKTLREVAAAVAKSAQRPVEQTAAECAGLVRALAARGFVGRG